MGVKGEEKKIVGPDYLPPDEAAVQLNAAELGNPRLIINVPADKIFLEITKSEPPMLVVVVRADHTISAKGALSHAHDMLLLEEPRLNARASLSQGVSAAAAKLTEGVA